MKSPAERCYNVWREFTHVQPHFSFIETVDKSGENSWNCRYRGLFGSTSMEIQLTEDVEGRILAWKTSSGPLAQGSVLFDVIGAETFVTFVVSYDPPGGRVGDILNNMFRFPGRAIEDGLLAWAKAMEKS